jgi:hypothetical protein
VFGDVENLDMFEIRNAANAAIVPELPDGFGLSLSAVLERKGEPGPVADFKLERWHAVTPH